MVRKALLVLLAATIVQTTSACNTIKGVGQDIESVGRAGDRAI